MNRIAKHALPITRVAKRLRRLGLSVKQVKSAVSFDLLINETLRITLRVSFSGKRWHRVTVAGKTYRYRYPTCHFNFHHHGEFKERERYTDIFVCMPMTPGKDIAEVFIIPWDKVTGKTFSLHGGRQPYRGTYAQYRDAWHLIAEMARGVHLPSTTGQQRRAVAARA